jgi:hypothetical protein
MNLTASSHFTDDTLDITSQVAAYLFTVEEGERLLTVRELADLLGASVGSISHALSTLEEEHVAAINRRGHLGSFLEGRSVGRLWQIAKDEPVVVAHSLPSHRRFEGLAGGIKRLLSDEHIQTYSIFLRGSLTRMRALEEKRCHVTVLSRFAADDLCHDEEEIVLTLPPGSFITGHKVFYRPRKDGIDRPLRVAIDRTSYDHYRLTELEFKDQDVTFVDTNATLIRRLLVEGVVDAAMWTTDDMEFHLIPEVLERPLSESVLQAIGDTDTCAALVIRADDQLTRNLIKSVIDIEALIAYQKAVILGEIVPDF